MWDDEDARLLATTFNSMTDSIARFQREAAQRERLSSLGRLSTVVAHEIRNPLMIIKTALRTLRAADADARAGRAPRPPTSTRRSARLNRIVSEVLDFARPIKFDLAPANLNALCEDAARAAAERGTRRRRDPPRSRFPAGHGHDRRRAAAAGAGQRPHQRPARGRGPAKARATAGTRSASGPAACRRRASPSRSPTRAPASQRRI